MPRPLERAAALAGQLVLIAVGAYLGLQAEQWREDRAKAALGRSALRNFRDELAANRASLLRVRSYHDAAAAGLGRVFDDQLRTGRRLDLFDVARASGFNGTQSVTLQTTAYDLAVATQALAEVPPGLGLRIARAYTRQRALADYESQFGQALLTTTPAPRDDARRTLFMLTTGMQEIAQQERRLVATYDSLRAPLDSALARR